MELTKKLGQIRLQYQFTDKAYLLPPNCTIYEYVLLGNMGQLNVSLSRESFD